MTTFDRLVSSVHLKECKLWPDSMEEQYFTYGGLRQSHVRDKIAKLEVVDDRTANENEYLVALKKTLEG